MQKEDRMDLIVNAAIDEFLEKGFEGASMERIARRAGLTKGGLYHYFPGKDALLIFANQKLALPVERLLSEALRKPSPSEGLKLYIDRYIKFWSRRGRQLEFFFLTMTKLNQMPEAQHAWASYYRGTTQALAGLYQKGLEAREFKQLEPGIASLCLSAALDGALGMLMVDPGLRPSATAALKQTFVDAFAAGRGRSFNAGTQPGKRKQ